MALVGVPGIAGRGVGRRRDLRCTLTHVRTLKLGDGQPWKKVRRVGREGEVVKLSVAGLGLVLFGG